MDLTPSLIQQVSVGAENSPSMGTCSVVKRLGLEWTQMEQEMVWGHQNKVGCHLTSTPPSRECCLGATGFEKVNRWGVLCGVVVRGNDKQRRRGKQRWSTIGKWNQNRGGAVWR